MMPMPSSSFSPLCITNSQNSLLLNNNLTFKKIHCDHNPHSKCTYIQQLSFLQVVNIL